jgi:hypothetical protein
MPKGTGERRVLPTETLYRSAEIRSKFGVLSSKLSPKLRTSHLELSTLAEPSGTSRSRRGESCSDPAAERRRMTLGLVQRFDGDLDLVVGGAFVLELRGHDGLVLADAASGGMQVREAGQ